LNDNNGTITVEKFASKILKNNPLKDPYIRDIMVYLPPEYSRSRSKGYVGIIFLQGFGANSQSFFNSDPFTENIEDKINRLIREKKCGPLVLIFPDCFTKLGGNQYINSIATGNYEDYIIKEIVPYIRKKYNIACFGAVGHSSGGFGSFTLGMHNPKIIQGVANHSGDSGFEYCYLPDFPIALTSLMEAGGVKKWFKMFWEKQNKKNHRDFTTLNILAMAAHYSPDEFEEMNIKLPFDLNSGEFLGKVWKKWCEWDPVKKIHKFKANLKELKYLYIDCGTKDEFNMNIGANLIHKKLTSYQVIHYYEEFNGGHRNTSYRFDISIPKLYDALTQ